MNLYEITKNIISLAYAEHVNSVYEGDIYDLNKQQDIRYPVFVITQQSHAGSTNDKIKIGYNLFFVDRLLEDKSNQLEIQDWAIRATENVIEGITAANLGYVSDNYTINTFTERFDSLCAGAVCQMQVNVSVDNCDVPRIVTSINGKSGDVYVAGIDLQLKTINGEALEGTGNIELVQTNRFNNYVETQEGINENKVDKTGLKTINGQTLVGEGDIEVETEQFISSVDSDFDVIDGQLRLYKVITINSFTGGSTNEIGSTVTSVNLAWSLNKNPNTQTLTDAVVGLSDRSASLTGLSITANKNYTLTVTDSRGASSSKTTTVAFYPRKYYGVSNKTQLSNADVLALVNKPLASSTPTALTNYDCTGGKYAWFCVPNSWAEPKFYVGGLPNSDFEKTTISLTNASGYTQTYKLYRTANIQTGVLSIEVK